MKLEMGESLILSWLKHIKGCQLIQSSWKASPNWQKSNEKLVESIYNLGMKSFNVDGKSIFKGSSISQLLKQSEIDVLGVNFDRKEIYAVDIAFHGAGLNYGGKTENFNRIAKKVLRMSMSLCTYFNDMKASVIFTSPKASNELYQNKEKIESEINNLFKELNLNYNAQIVLNNEFQTEILMQILAKANEIQDTSELFLRSIQLANKFSKRDK